MTSVNQALMLRFCQLCKRRKINKNQNKIGLAHHVKTTWRLLRSIKKHLYNKVSATWVRVRKKEHESKVRLTNEDIKNGKLMAAKERMGKEDGGLAKHSTDWNKGIDWENTWVLGIENRLSQGKVREGTESLRNIHNKKKVLNNFESLMTWRPVLDRYFYEDSVNTRARAL